MVAAGLRDHQAAATGAQREMVAVWLKDRDETTLKYFFYENGRVRLQPANPQMSPIFVDNLEQVEIRGRVVMVVRQLEKRGGIKH
jgi:repressor LexA